MAKATYEVHTATTGPGDPEKEPTSYLGALAASFNGPAFDSAASTRATRRARPRH